MILKAKMTMLLAFGLALSGRGTFDRDNLLDPASGEFVGDLETALIGTWSMVSGAENQVYVFKSNGSVDLVDYSSPSGGTVDRNASYPATRISRVVLAVYLKALACNVKRMVRALLPKPGVLSPATR